MAFFVNFLYFSTPGLIGDGQNLLKSWYQSYMDNLTPKRQYFGAPETKKSPNVLRRGHVLKSVVSPIYVPIFERNKVSSVRVFNRHPFHPNYSF